MGQETTVTVVGFCGALTAILLWLLSYFVPALMMTAPPGLEAAVTTVFVGLLCYVLPDFKLFSKKEGGE